MARPQIIGVILARNEAHNIGPCIQALHACTDAVVVWDSVSSDATVEQALAAGALVVQRPFDDYAAQRQAALNALDADWIFFVDADERITPALASEVRRVVDAAAAGGAAGYWVARRNFIVGHETRGGGFYPDYQLRLLKRTSAHYDATRKVHEIVRLDGSEGYLQEPLIHLNYLTWEQFHRKQRGYAQYEAIILAQRGIRPQPHNFVLQPWREFRRRFFDLRGWQDGWHGLRLAILLAWYYGFMPYRYLLGAKVGERREA